MEKTNALTPDTILKVTNRSDSIVIYNIPERHIRREFYIKETKRVPYQEIIDLSSIPGGRELMYNYLLIEDEKALQEGLDIEAEPEYWLTNEEIPSWIESSTLDEFKDALDFAPDGVKDLIKKYAVENKLNDVNKRLAIKDQLGFDVNAAISNNEESKSEEVPAVQTSKRRATAKKSNIPNYKVTSTSK